MNRIIPIGNVRTIFGHTLTSDNFRTEIYQLLGHRTDSDIFSSEAGTSSPVRSTGVHSSRRMIFWDMEMAYLPKPMLSGINFYRKRAFWSWREFVSGCRQVALSGRRVTLQGRQPTLRPASPREMTSHWFKNERGPSKATEAILLEANTGNHRRRETSALMFSWLQWERRKHIGIHSLINSKSMWDSNHATMYGQEEAE